jgi:Tetrahydromethanopterin S-methyltransferase, subunit E
MINLIKIWRKKIMDPVTLGVVALMGAVATIGGAAEDLESDIGSQSNPNSSSTCSTNGTFTPYDKQGDFW